MPSLHSLPYEVLHQIFKDLKKVDYNHKQENLAQCALTCRSWRQPAQVLLLETVSLSNPHDLHEARRILKDERDGSSLGDVVKKVHFRLKHVVQHRDNLYRGWSFDMLDLLDELFPHLEVLDFDSSHFPQPQYVFDILSNKKFKFLVSIPIMESCNRYSKLHRSKKVYRDILKMLKKRKSQ